MDLTFRMIQRDHEINCTLEDPSLLQGCDQLLQTALMPELMLCSHRWRLASTAQRVAKSGSQENSVSLPDASVKDLGQLLRQGGYSVFLQQGSLYAFKGLAGRFAPIGVHISMLAIILGADPRPESLDVPMSGAYCNQMQAASLAHFWLLFDKHSLPTGV